MTEMLYPVTGTGRYCSGILLDLDNTLYDFVSATEAACDAVISLTGGTREGLIEEFLFGPWGVESHEAIRSYLRKIGSENCFAEACNRFERRKQEEMRLFPGVPGTLKRLFDAGLQIAAVSNASSEHADPRLRYFGIREYFEVLMTADKAGVTKPDAGIFKMAAKSLNIIPERLIMVGDNIYADIEPAMKLGIYAIHARYGNRVPADMEMSIRPDRTIQEFSELLSILGI